MEPPAMQANVVVVFWSLINVIQKEGQQLIIITSISKIYVLKCQSVGYKTVEEVRKCGSLVIWKVGILVPEPNGGSMTLKFSD